ALALAVGRVRPARLRPLIHGQPRPAEALQDVLLGALDVARPVGVLDAEDERSSLPACEEVVVEGRSQAADVEEAGGARGEADADGHEREGRAEETGSYRRSPPLMPCSRAVHRGRAHSSRLGYS